ncbi:failed axon connections homolog [Elysia marginata]|uniref:Failed axon connections homolog n=1 Tax=Elysia marginata TaxID=1093978 RepID=A0AAV4GUD3_9GAST|nr:failed axon connections homolog [Elysia marginata]
MEAPPNTVVLYQLSRAPFTPSLTPFAVKLETYLRLAKIPYQNDFNGKRSSKGKFPWISYSGEAVADSQLSIDYLNSKLGIDLNKNLTDAERAQAHAFRVMNDFNGKRSSKGKFPWISYNGEAVADSQLSIDYLNSKLGIDLNKNLTDAERAQAHAFRVMVDENLYWCLVYFRWIYEKYAYSVALVVPWYMMLLFKRGLRKQLHAQGMGRHTTEEIKQKMLQDLEALSAQLGKPRSRH